MRQFFIFLCLLATTFGFYDHQTIPDAISSEVELLKHGKISKNLRKSINDLSSIKNKKLKSQIFCQTCELVFSQVIAYRRSGAGKDTLTSFGKKLCNAFTDWGKIACNGYIEIEIDTILYIIDNRKDLTSSRICAIYFQKNGCLDPNAEKWEIPLPPPKYPINQSQIQYKTNPLKILHLTDFHYDPLYSPGSKAVCDVPLCCQKSNGPALKTKDAAGFWGDYHVCDIPWHTISNFTNHIQNETFDFVYYTGDIISHKSWASNKNDNTKAIQKLFQHFSDTFGNTTLFPIVGNHEPHPTDFWSYKNVTPAISTQWVFDLMSSEWKRWLSNDTTATILQGGFYTTKINQSNLRIIGLNSNVCFLSNLWLIYNDIDPYGQLKWLVDVLTKAEKNNEVVHILSHIPPGELNCHQQWSNQFRKIVNRFAPIIAAQFNGHTHLDELRFFKDLENPKKIINVAFNAGSFTTFVGFNPNYRIYQVDPVNYRVLDYDHYTFNLTEANLHEDKPPNWYKLYSLKEAYGLKNTTNKSFNDLIGRLSTNQTLAQQYYRFQGRDSAPHLATKCDSKCLKQVVCGITAVETNELMQCLQLKQSV